MSAGERGRFARWAPVLLAGVLPALLLSVGVAQFILRHFFVDAPYLLDSGWYSAIIYRAGVFPHNPQIACNYADWYFGVHLSPLVSMFSILSYLAPLPRIEWYAVFQAVVHLPVGVALYVLASRIDPAGALRRLPSTILAAFAFAFSGLVFRCIRYPHYEIAIPGLMCLTLATLVTNRPRLAWLFLVLTVSVREDAGLHTALALTPLLYLKHRGVDIPASRTRLLAMIGAAFGATVIGFVCQKVFFGSANLLRHEYLGDPTYGHITMESIVERMKTFHVVGAAIYYPFFATCVVAVIRRDPRYLLGWAAAVPWFLLNFAAVQEAKVNFDAYTVFPFIVSLFWVYLYGAALAPPARRMRRGLLELLFAGVCVTSTYAEVRDSVVRFKYLLKVMAMPGRLHRDTLHRFVTVLGEHRSDFRRLYVDPTIAAIALESVSASDAWYPGVGPIDSLAYHGFTVLRRDELVADIIANQLDVCTFMVPTQLRVCSRQPLPSETFAGLTTETVPSIFAFTTFKPPGTLVEPQRITVRPGVVVKGKLGLLPKGTYELTLDVDVALSTTDRSTDRAALEVASERTQLAFAVLDAGPHEIVLPFEADGAIARSFAITAGAATLTIRGAKVRPRSAAP